MNDMATLLADARDSRASWASVTYPTIEHIALFIKTEKKASHHTVKQVCTAFIYSSIISSFLAFNPDQILPYFHYKLMY